VIFLQASGDVYITNDPWEGTGHLHDITMVTPSFHRGAHVGFFACTAHIVDIGGRGFGADAASVYEEGLYIPIMKFADKGTVDATLMRIVRGNVREPDQLVGDIYAPASSSKTRAAPRSSGSPRSRAHLPMARLRLMDLLRRLP